MVRRAGRQRGKRQDGGRPHFGIVGLPNERFDLLMRQRDYFRPPMQTFLKLLGVPRFAERARELGGLDVTAAGSIRWSP